MPFSIADIVNDAVFAQSFNITRSIAGTWQLGRYQQSKGVMKVWGAIQPPSPTDLAAVPEADRVMGIIAIYIAQPIYETNLNLTNGTSDIVTWHNEQYRVEKVEEWQDYGYWKALAVRMSGQ